MPFIEVEIIDPACEFIEQRIDAGIYPIWVRVAFEIVETLLAKMKEEVNESESTLRTQLILDYERRDCL